VQIALRLGERGGDIYLALIHSSPQVLFTLVEQKQTPMTWAQEFIGHDQTSYAFSRETNSEGLEASQTFVPSSGRPAQIQFEIQDRLHSNRPL